MSRRALKVPAHVVIRILIENRRRGLGLSKSDLARRLGYRNIAKGLRRLHQVCDGRFEHAEGLLRALPEALELDSLVVEAAIAETLEQLRRTRDEAWRATFVPHAVILTERKTPEPIYVAAIIGVHRILRIDFNLATDRSTFVHQTLASIRARVRRWNRDANPNMPLGSYQLPAFGRVTGFVINYEPERAVRFDLNGRALEVLPRSYRTADAQLRTRGGQFQAADLPA
jgi:hypothetical protein